MKPLCCYSCRPTLFVSLLMLLLVSNSIAQEEEKFGTKGITELGGTVSFQSVTQVTNGVSSSTTTVITLLPYIGYFVADRFELGLNPLGIMYATSGGQGLTQIRTFFAPTYYFPTRGNGHPYLGVLLGYTSQTYTSTASGFSWGGNLGVKVEVVQGGLINLSLQYLRITTTPSGATERYGTNEISFSAGFTVWM